MEGRRGSARAPWVVTVGGFNWVKGIWECISMLEGSGVGLVVIGRGSDEDLHSLQGACKGLGCRYVGIQ